MMSQAVVDVSDWQETVERGLGKHNIILLPRPESRTRAETGRENKVIKGLAPGGGGLSRIVRPLWRANWS